MLSERGAIQPNINTASAHPAHISIPTTNSTTVHVSRFPSATSSLNTSPPTSLKSTKPPSATPDPRALRVVTLLNALGPSLGPVAQRPQAQNLSPPHNPSARPRHAPSVAGAAAPMAGSTTKSSFLDRLSGSPSLGSGSSSTPISSDQQLSEKKAVRMVGRGGSGSKPRSVNAALKAPSEPRIKRAKSDLSGVSSISSKDGKVRYVGRGGQGSKERVAEGEKEGVQKDGVPGGSLKLPWKKARKSQLVRSPDTESPTNAGDLGHRSLRRQKSEASGVSGSTFASSTTPASSPNGPNFGDSSVSSLGSIGEKPQSPPGKPTPSLHPGEYNGKSINKLAQKMGDLPPHLIYQQLLNQHVHRNDSAPPLPTHIKAHKPAHSVALSSVPLSEKSSSTVTQHRVVSILSSLGPPSTAPRWRSDSLLTTSSFETTQSCELHRFGLADDMSENWGEMKDDHDDRRDSGCYAENVGWEDVFEAPSPIAFSPPTPVDMKRAAARCSVCHIETGMEPVGDGDTVSEFSTAASAVGFGGARAIGSSVEEEDDGGIQGGDAIKSHTAAGTSNGNVHGASCRDRGTHLHDMKTDSSSPPSRHHARCPSDIPLYTFAGPSSLSKSERFDNQIGDAEEDEGGDDTPLVERACGAGSPVRRQLEEEGHALPTPPASLRDPSWISSSTSSSFKTSYRPPPLKLPTTRSGHSGAQEPKLKIHSSVSSPSASTKAFSTTSPPRSPPHSATFPSRVPPNTPFSTLTPLQLPTSGGSKHLRRWGSMSSSRSSGSVAISNASDSFERSLLAQVRRSSQSTDNAEEDEAIPSGSWQSNWRGVEWHAGHEEQGKLASNPEVRLEEGDRGKGKGKQSQLWTGEWNTDIDDVIRTLRLL